MNCLTVFTLETQWYHLGSDFSSLRLEVKLDLLGVGVKMIFLGVKLFLVFTRANQISPDRESRAADFATSRDVRDYQRCLMMYETVKDVSDVRGILKIVKDVP